MPIAADTTMFRYLVVLEVTDIPPALFGRVLIPPAISVFTHRPPDTGCRNGYSALYLSEGSKAIQGETGNVF